MGIYFIDLFIEVGKDICKNIFVVLLVIVKIIWIGEWGDKLWYIYKVEYYMVFKKNVLYLN